MSRQRLPVSAAIMKPEPWTVQQVEEHFAYHGHVRVKARSLFMDRETGRLTVNLRDIVRHFDRQPLVGPLVDESPDDLVIQGSSDGHLVIAVPKDTKLAFSRSDPRTSGNKDTRFVDLEIFGQIHSRVPMKFIRPELFDLPLAQTAFVSRLDVRSNNGRLVVSPRALIHSRPSTSFKTHLVALTEDGFAIDPKPFGKTPEPDRPINFVPLVLVDTLVIPHVASL